MRMAARQDYQRRENEPEEKVCTKCGVSKPIEDFSFARRKGYEVRKARCKTCINAYHVLRRERDPAVKRQHKIHVKANAAKLVAAMNLLKQAPCLDCGRKFRPWQMQFDHVVGEKLDDISSIARGGSTKRFWAEVEKCEVVCACCHADRTYRRSHPVVV